MSTQLNHRFTNFHHQNRNWLGLCRFLFILLYLPSSLCLHVTSNSSHSNEDYPPVREIARSLNEEAFLKALVSLKDGSNMRYKTIPRAQGLMDACTSKINHDDVGNSKVDILSDSPECLSAICEYTGTLWFFRKAGIKFREIMSIKNISPDEQQALVECQAEYHNGKRWVECARTTCEILSGDVGNKCSLQSRNEETKSKNQNFPAVAHISPVDNMQAFCNSNSVNNNMDLKLNVKTNVLINLPGISGQVAKKINSTFQDAVISFIRNRHSVPVTSMSLQ